MKPHLVLAWVIAAYALGRAIAPEAPPARLDPSALPEMQRQAQAGLDSIRDAGRRQDAILAELADMMRAAIPDRPPADMRRDR